MFSAEYNSLPGDEGDYAIPPGITEDDVHYDSFEDLVVDYTGQEIVVGDKVKFVVELLDGEEEYWVGFVTHITEFSADADDDGRWYGITPTVAIEYNDIGTTAIESFSTYQKTGSHNIFICEELEIVE